MKISQEELKTLLHYDESTGLFTNIVDRGKVAKKGQTPGHLDKKGYVTITVNRVCYRAHHLAWLYVYGKHPYQIDHIDGNRANNCITNLRECTLNENMQNVSKCKKQTHSRHIGVSFHKAHGLWVGYLVVDGKRHSKQFRTEEEAVGYRAELKRTYHSFNPIDRQVAA